MMAGFKAGLAAAAAVVVMAGMGPAATAAGAGCPMFEIAAMAAPADPTARTFHALDGAVVVVASPALVSSRDVVDATVSTAEGQTGLGVRVSDAAAARVRVYTAGHVGGRLAFIVEGRARMVVKILDPIARDGFWISPMAPDAANKLASSLRDCQGAPG